MCSDKIPKKNVGLKFLMARKNNFGVISEIVVGTYSVVLVTYLSSFNTEKSEVNCLYCPLSVSVREGNMVSGFKQKNVPHRGRGTCKLIC
jgi:hypothetical protein